MAWLVNGEYIDDAAIREESELIRQRLEQELPEETAPEVEMPELDSDVRQWAVDNLIERALLRQTASGFTEALSAPDDAEEKPDWRVDAFIHHLTEAIPRPNRREVSEYYRKNQILFLTPECAHASQIQAESQQIIETAEAALRQGRPFAEVAEEYSAEAGSGGDLGWFLRGQMPEEFDAVVFKMKPGQVSPIFRSASGFHLAKLHARKPAGVLPLRDVYSVAEQLLLKRRRDEAIERFLEEVRAKSDIRRVRQESGN